MPHVTSRIHSAALLTATLALLAGCAQQTSPDQARSGTPTAAVAPSLRPLATPGTFVNPLRPLYSADPDIEYYNGNYYLTYTNDANVNSIVIRKAASLADLSRAPETVVWQDAAPDRCCTFWAPSLFHFGGRWYVYYPANTGGGAEHRMHVLESAGDDPLGPYSYKGRLGAPNNDSYAIDGVAFERGGQLYLVYSMGAPGGRGIYIAPMSNPWTISGDAVLISHPSSSGTSWDTNNGGYSYNEAPTVVQRGGVTHITFSGNPADSPDYAVGLLTNTDGNLLRAESWVKSGPVLTRNDAAGVYGPGSNDFFTSPSGETWTVYHAKTSPNWTFDTRTARASRVEWNGNTPVFGAPVSVGTPVGLPGGDPGTAYSDANWLANAGFEAGGDPQTPANWTTWPGQAGRDANANFTEGGGYNSNLRLTHYKDAPYEVYTGQSVSVENGVYTVRAWVVSGGGQNDAFLSVKDYGGGEEKRSIKDVAAGWPNWRLLEIPNVNVTTGQITVGVYSNALKDQWLSVDDVRLERQP